MRVLDHHRIRAEDTQGVHVHEMVKAFRDLGCEGEIVALVGAEGPRAGASPGRLWEGLRRLPPFLYELMTLSYNVYGNRRLTSSRQTDGQDSHSAHPMWCGL